MGVDCSWILKDFEKNGNFGIFFFINFLFLMISLLYVRIIVLYLNCFCVVKIDLKWISFVVFWYMNVYDYKNIEIGCIILNLFYF